MRRDRLAVVFPAILVAGALCPESVSAGSGACVSAPDLFDYAPHRDDAEAEQLAMILSGELRAPDATYERIRRDLAAIRAAYPLLETVVDSPDWVPNDLLVEVALPSPGYAELNRYYQVVVDDPLFADWHALTFCDNVNALALATIYTAVPEVEAAEPNFIFGTDNRITISTVAPTWRYEIDDGFHDCFDGCDCLRAWVFDVAPDGDVQFVSYSESGLSWCVFDPAPCCGTEGGCSTRPVASCLDGGGIPHEFWDTCDADADGDGRDAVCGDNCPDVPNPGFADADADAHGDVCDSCIHGPNPQQGAAPLGQTILALDEATFGWPDPADALWVRGHLALVAAYDVAEQGSLDLATTLVHGLVPPVGAGFFYLLRPDCPVGSWQNTPGAEPGRDLALP
jgi:hypothetical protein